MRLRTFLISIAAAAPLALLAACGGTPPNGTVTPAAPTNVTATPGAGFVTVAWEHDGANATGFVVYRESTAAESVIRFARTASAETPWEVQLPDTAASPFAHPLGLAAIATVGADARSYRDDDVEPGASYRYAVAAKGASGHASHSVGHDGAAVTPDPEPEPNPVGENPDPTRYLALLLQDGAGNAIENATASIVLVRSEDWSPRVGYRRTNREGVALLVDLETQPWVAAATYDAILTVEWSGSTESGLVAVLTDVAVPGTIELATDDPRFLDVAIDLIGATGSYAYVTVATDIEDWTVAGYPVRLSPSTSSGTLRMDPGPYELFVDAMISESVAVFPTRAVDVTASSTISFDLEAEPAFTLTASFEPPPGAPAASRVSVCPRPVRDAFWLAAWNCMPASSIRVHPGTYDGSVSVRLPDGSSTWAYSFTWPEQAYGPAGASAELLVGGPAALTIEPVSASHKRGDRVTFGGGLVDAQGLPIRHVSSNASGAFVDSQMDLRVTDSTGAIVHEVSGTASLLARPWDHEYWLPNDAPGGTYVAEVSIDTGPYLGPLTASTTIFVDVPGEPPDLEATVLWQTEGFTGSVNALAWDAARGRMIASGSGGLRAYDAVTGDVAWVFDACERRLCIGRDLAFLGDTLVVATSDGLTVIDAESGTGAVTVVKDWDLPSSIRAATLRPSVADLLTISFSGEIDLWDTDTWTVTRSFELESLFAVSAAWRPDGGALAIGTLEGQALVLDADDGSVLTTYAGHAESERNRSINGIAWSPDGTLIASGGGDERVRVWRANDGEELAVLQLGEVARFVTQVAWSPDGSRLAAVGADGALIIQGAVAVWDADGWEPSWSAMLDGPSGYAYAVAWSPDGTAVFTGDKLRRVTRWDAATGTPAWARQGDANEGSSVAWAPDGNRFVTGTREDNGVLVWNLAGDLVASLRADEEPERNFGRYVNAVDWSVDGTRIVSAHFDGGVSLWDATTYEVIYTLSRRQATWHEGIVSAVRFSPDGAAFVTGSRDATARIWRTSDGVLVRTLSGHTNEVYGVDWSPDGALIATASTDGTARVWDADTGDELLVLDWGARSVYSVAFSPDGGTLATGGDWSAVRLWDPLTGELLRELQTNDSMFSLSWSPDGALLAGGSTLGPTTVWDAATGGWIVLDGVGRSSLGVGWSPNGQHLAIATWDPAVTLVELSGDGAP